MDINKWSAKACGVVCKQYAGGDWYFIAPNIEESHYEWNYKDPRCRQVIRERFFQHAHYHTLLDGEVRLTVWLKGGEGEDHDIEVQCKTIAEAECKCIEAIHKGNEDE